MSNFFGLEVRNISTNYYWYDSLKINACLQIEVLLHSLGLTCTHFVL